MKVGTLIGAGLGMTAGHFLYQALFHHHWMVAAERSFFTVTALATLYLCIRVERYMEQQ